MPMFEYKCEECTWKFESYSSKAPGAKTRPCPKCGYTGHKIEISRPAKRNPDRGIQR